jgi:hypothetical protein
MASLSSLSSISPAPTALPPTPPPHLFRTITQLSSTATTSTYLCLPRNIPPFSPDTATFPQLVTTNLSRANTLLLPHFRAVTLSTTPSILRNLCNRIESTNLDRIYKAQFTPLPNSSWLVTTPVFSVDLSTFGLAHGGIPTFFLAHILLGILDAGHSGVVLFDLYPRSTTWQFRGWPEVVVWPRDDSDEDVLWIMEQVAATWSDCVPFMDTQGDDEPLLVLLREVKALRREGGVTLDGVRERFTGRLEDMRLLGPAELPVEMLRHMHADLATDREIEVAMRAPTVIRFERRYEAFLKLVAGERVDMGSGGHAGMKTVRIMVVRFGARKNQFLRIVGVDNGPWEAEDADGEYEVSDNVPDMWTPDTWTTPGDQEFFGNDLEGN